jgi:hypothetical protein
MIAAISSSSIFLAVAAVKGSPSISDRRLTSPEDSPDSHKVIGRIRTHANLPVPECLIFFRFSSGTTDEPVKMKWRSPSE